MSKRDIAGFFRYARARHEVHLRRVAGLPREKWTRDPILRQYRFTNVFRELDKTTVWFRRHVRDPLRDAPEVLLATVVFRLLNRIEVGEAIFCQTFMTDEGDINTAFEKFAKDGNKAHLKFAIKQLCSDGPYVTGAYIISSPAGMSKLDGVLRVIGDFNRDSKWRLWVTDMHEQAGMFELRAAWELLRDQPYIGPFHAYEIVTDLRHTALLDRAPDIMTWANPGPGAKRGANRVFRGNKGDHVTRDQVIDEMRVLLSWSRSEKYWPQADANWPAWEMRDVEHTLCEFDKYERVRLGEGKPRGVYR